MINKNCQVKITCNQCEISGNSNILVNLNEQSSFSQSIQFNISSTSSIPDEISSINQTIEADQDKIFRGSEPTVFDVIAIPSIFETNDPKQKEHGGETGYHLINLGHYIKGSQYNNQEAQFGQNLHAKINFILSENSLLTKQTLKVSPIILISAILGSVFGIKSIVGGVMSFVERRLLLKKISINQEINKKKIIQLKKQIYQIKDDFYLNFQDQKQLKKIDQFFNQQQLVYKNITKKKNQIAPIKPEDLLQNSATPQEESTEYSKIQYLYSLKKLKKQNILQSDENYDNKIEQRKLTESYQNENFVININNDESKDTIYEKQLKPYFQ